MAVEHQWPLQEAIFAAVSAGVASENIDVSDHVLSDPPAEHIRLEGFAMDDDGSFKNVERGKHSFMVSFFIEPKGEMSKTRGLKRVWEVLNLIHAQVKIAEVNGRCPVQRYMSAESDDDAASFHGLIRYNITL